MDSTSPSQAANARSRMRSAEDPVLRRELRRDLFARNAFEFLVAALALLAVPIILLSKGGLHTSAVGHMTASLAPSWLALFGLGALLILIGIIRLSPRAEIIGLILFTAAMVTDGVAVIFYSGGGGAAGAMMFLAIGIASIWRVRQIWKLVDAARRRTGEHEQ